MENITLSSFGNLTGNGTVNSSKAEGCESRAGFLLSVSLIDILTVLMGQPVIAKLLWIAVTSKKTIDILNFNLSLFHYIQYLMTTLHLLSLFLLPHVQFKFLMFLFVYVQIGGPMNLSFICMERYVAVIHPTSYPLLKKYRCREVCAVAVWLVAVPFAMANVLVYESISTAVERVINAAPDGVMLFMTGLTIWCNYSILRALRQSGPGRDELHPVKKRAFKTVRAISAIAMSCYIPVTIVKFQFADENEYGCELIPVYIFLFSVASVVHPMFYLSTKGKLFSCSKPEK